VQAFRGPRGEGTDLPYELRPSFTPTTAIGQSAGEQGGQQEGQAQKKILIQYVFSKIFSQEAERDKET